MILNWWFLFKNRFELVFLIPWCSFLLQFLCQCIIKSWNFLHNDNAKSFSTKWFIWWLIFELMSIRMKKWSDRIFRVTHHESFLISRFVEEDLNSKKEKNSKKDFFKRDSYQIIQSEKRPRKWSGQSENENLFIVF